MPDQDQPRWPSPDPDRPPSSWPAQPPAQWPAQPPAQWPAQPPAQWPAQPPAGWATPPAAKRRRPLVAGLIAVLTVLASVSVLAALPALRAAVRPPTIGGVALPASTAASSTSSTTPAPTTTTTTRRPRPIYLLADHPLLAAGVTLPDATCTLPPFRRDTASLNAYYLAFVACMNATWQPVLATHGMPFHEPKVSVAIHPGQTGCGDLEADEDVGEFTALYCPADETLYLPVDRLKRVDRGRASSHLAVVAHEYAHHVQELSGLLSAAAEETVKAGEDTPAGNQVTRRTELQANCFAGLVLAAAAGRGIAKALADQSVVEFRYGSLPQTHGTSAHQAAWAKQGYQQRTTAACNTWSAPPNTVS